jgi:hypothetical protein
MSADQGIGKAVGEVMGEDQRMGITGLHDGCALKKADLSR